MLFKSRGLKRWIISSRKRLIEDTRLIVKDLRRLNKERSKNPARAVHRQKLMLAEIGELIAGYKDWLHTDNKTPSYTVSSLFLMESFKLLNRREVESLHFVTGPEIEGTKVLSEIVDLRLEKQSMVYARAETGSIREALVYLAEHGFKLWGCFHIHPGFGPSSIYPSGTDKNLDKLLNNGGYDCIGAIFSRDGFVRFFSSKRFEINIYGNGVEEVDENTYRLVEVNQVHDKEGPFFGSV